MTTKQLGDIFEQICYKFLRERYPRCTVWLLFDLPTAISETLNIPTNDIGIDIIMRENEDIYYAIQCKFRTNRYTRFTYHETATFFATSQNFYKRIFMTNCYTFPTKLIQLFGDNLELILGETFDNANIPCDVFLNMYDYYHSHENIISYRRKELRPYQQKAVSKCVKYYKVKKKEKGKLIMACGTGKTVVSCKIVEELGLQKILFLVPSLYLLKH